MASDPVETSTADPGEPSARKLVLVTGAGRSGTSTVAGSLHHLGLHVPLPILNANASNPRGFFESTWPLKFHKRILARAAVDPFDARPEALGRMADTLRAEDRTKLETWLGKQAGEDRQLVVKDPRSSWVTDLWAETAGGVGLDIGYVVMLRHPAEVVGSRTAYYAANRDEAGVRKYQVVKLAGWINTNLLVERQTRGLDRAFIRYDALIDDWRAAMTTVRDDLGLAFNSGLGADEPHSVDDFVAPDLRRVRVTWDELDVPETLRDLAEEVWAACGILADQHGHDEKAQARLDAAGERYAQFYRDAQAVANDTIAGERKLAVRKAEARTRKEMQDKVAKAETAAREATTAARKAEQQLRQQPPPKRSLVRRVGSRVRRQFRSR